MVALRQTTAAQDEAIDRIAIRWRELRDRPVALDRGRAAAALAALYDHVAVPAPPVIFYESPAAAFADVARWEPLVGRIGRTVWAYQLPSCHPCGYYRACSVRGRSDEVDLGVRRWANAHGCYAHDEPLPDLAGLTISAPLLDTIWRRVLDTLGWGWCDAVHLALESAPGHELVEAALDRGLVDSALCVRDHVYLGPCDWLVAEAACAEICTDVLGVRMSGAYADAVAGIARCCGLVYTLEDAVLACERPRRIETSGDVLVAHFPDGTWVAAQRPSCALDERP